MRELIQSTLALAFVLAACGEADPTVGSCGGFGGPSCPPASQCVIDDCGHSDCAGKCLANVKCDPTTKDTCPSGTICNADKNRCMPPS
jgi:hypothetical protein